MQSHSIPCKLLAYLYERKPRRPFICNINSNFVLQLPFSFSPIFSTQISLCTNFTNPTATSAMLLTSFFASGTEEMHFICPLGWAVVRSQKRKAYALFVGYVQTFFVYKTFEREIVSHSRYIPTSATNGSPRDLGLAK